MALPQIWPLICLATLVPGIDDDTLNIAYSSIGDNSTAHVGTYDINAQFSDGSGKASNYTVTIDVIGANMSAMELS